ncbi:MAG: DUF2269 family protein [Solirubrobacteraceae bacterium]
MTLATLDFYTVVLFVHIVAAIVAFGVTFGYPLLFTLAERGEPRSVPFVLTFTEKAGRWLVAPGMVVLLLAGIYLAGQDPWDFSQGWISAAFVIIVVLFGIQGGYYAGRVRKAREIATRDIAVAAPGAEPRLSAEYLALSRQMGVVGVAQSLLILLAVFDMVWKPGL